VLEKADVVGSTSQLIDAAVRSDAREFVICTAHGVIHELERQTAGTGKRFFFPRTIPVCPNMARVTAEKVLACLRDKTGEVGLPDESVIARSTAALDRMLEMAR
jgi:quinolinate synthase